MKNVGELTTLQRRRALAYANRLSELALSAPDAASKQETYKAVRAIESKYGFSRAEKKARLLLLIKVGAASHRELEAESGFHGDDVRELIKELEAEGKVILHRLGSGSGGRPPLRIFIK